MTHKSKMIWISNVDQSEHASEEAVIGYDAAYSNPAQDWVESYLKSTGRFKTESGLSGAIKAHALFIAAYESAKASGELDLGPSDDSIADVLKTEEVEVEVEVDDGTDIDAVEEVDEKPLTAKQKRNLKTAEKLKEARDAEKAEEAEEAAGSEPSDSIDPGTGGEKSSGEEDPDAWMYE